MRGTERVVFTFGSLGEAGQAPTLTQGPDPVTPAGQDLVWIGLVPHIPDQPVARGIENMMQRDRQLHDPETSPEVPAGDRNGTDRFGAQFVRQLPQSGLRQAAQVPGSIEGI
jgi:hypothetical protein